MISIKELLTAPSAQLKFVSDYIQEIRYFKEKIEIFEKSRDKKETPIKNTDLWIDAYIGMVPELQDFRDFVRSEMLRLGIQIYDEYTYKNLNHYISGYKLELEKFRSTLLVEDNNTHL